MRFLHQRLEGMKSKSKDKAPKSKVKAAWPFTLAFCILPFDLSFRLAARAAGPESGSCATK
jgi:hypothetical protein